MTKLTDEQFKEIFGEYKGSIVIEQDSNPEITQESSNDLVTITMNLVPPGQLMDASNISTLEYIKDEKPEVKANADVIMANYHNRSIEQIHLVDEVISNQYGLVESAVLWLEVINSNLNQLMGLVSVNNYLIGMMGVGGGIGQSDSSIDVNGQLTDSSNIKSNTDNFVGLITTMGGGATLLALVGGPAGAFWGAVISGLGYIVSYFSDQDIDWSNLKEQIFGDMDYDSSDIIYNYETPVLIVSGTNRYSYAQQMLLPTFTGNKDDKINYPSWLPSSEYEKYAENYGGKPVTEKSETNNLQSIATQELTGLAKAVLSIEQLDMFKTHTTSGTIIAQKYESGARMSSKQSLTVPENVNMLYELDKPNLYSSVEDYNSEIMRKKHMNTPLEANTSISEDLTNSTFSENKYGPQQIEYTITVPVEINTTVNEAEKFDVDQILSTIGPEVENKIYGFISTQGLRRALDR